MADTSKANSSAPRHSRAGGNPPSTLITDYLDIWTSADNEKKSGRGRASGNAASVYGIKKLRELILELAVRGKLVPQDPNDEPASELLKKIRAEKDKLIAEGKIKKDKPLPSITDDEKPFELPNGWELARLQDLCTYIQRGKGPVYADFGSVRVVSQKCVQWKGFDIEQSRYVSDESISVYQEERFLQNDDLLWNSTGTGTVGRITVLQAVELNTLVADSHVTIIRPVTVSSRFLCTYISSPNIQKRIEPGSENALVSGTTNQVELNTSSVMSVVLPVPPLAEQNRIVAKVDELMALCDQLEAQHNNALDAHEKLVNELLGTLTRSQTAEDFTTNWQRIAAHFNTLFTTEASIDALKQTLLQLAVMGKLVPQDPNEEPASELLKKIRAEKEKLIAEGKIKKDKPLPRITDNEKPFELPSGWEWVRFEHVAENTKYALKAGPFGSALKKSMYAKNGYKIYGQEQVISGDENLGDYFIGEDKFQQLSSCAVKPGDILISLVGTIGRVLVLTKNCLPGIINPRLVKISLFSEINRSYVKVIFASPLLRIEMASKSHGGTMDILNLGLLCALVLPLPPVAEQHRIVAKVDELMALCDKLKTRITAANQLQQKLADVFVEQAVV